MAHGRSCSLACRIFLNQGLNPCPLHWQVVPLSLSHQGSPKPVFCGHFYISTNNEYSTHFTIEEIEADILISEKNYLLQSCLAHVSSMNIDSVWLWTTVTIMCAKVIWNFKKYEPLIIQVLAMAWDLKENNKKALLVNIRHFWYLQNWLMRKLNNQQNFE